MRTEAGLSQRALGIRADVSANYVGQVEQGRRAMSDIAVCEKWSLRCSRGSETATVSRHVGGEALARHPSDGKLKPIGDAPGFYVKVSAED